MKGGEDWSALSDIKSVHVAVAANSEVIPYTSLRKDAIAHREVKQALGVNGSVKSGAKPVLLWTSLQATAHSGTREGQEACKS